MAKFTMPMVYHHISHLQQVPGIQKRRHLHIGSATRRIDSHLDNRNRMSHKATSTYQPLQAIATSIGSQRIRFTTQVPLTQDKHLVHDDADWKGNNT